MSPESSGSDGAMISSGLRSAAIRDHNVGTEEGSVLPGVKSHAVPIVGTEVVVGLELVDGLCNVTERCRASPIATTRRSVELCRVDPSVTGLEHAVDDLPGSIPGPRAQARISGTVVRSDPKADGAGR